MSKSLLRGAIAGAVLALAAAASASASTTVAWTAGSDGDNWGTSFAGVVADTLQWGGSDTSYEAGITGPMAHSHGQDVNWSMVATIDGVQHTIFSQFLTGGAQTSLVGLGAIHFTKGVVTELDLTCDSCSFNTYHQFSDATMTFSVGGGAPEPAMWALMIVGMGAAGAMLRSRKEAVA